MYDGSVAEESGVMSSFDPSKLSEKSAVTSFPLGSWTFQTAPEPVIGKLAGCATAVKRAGFPFTVALALLGLTMIAVTPVRATVTVVEPEHAEQLPEAAVIVADPV